MQTAYSYRRFSAPSQAEGDSLRRQTEPSLAWCEKNKYHLDDSLRDEACSAFRGRNATGRRSALAGFLRKIEAGLVKPGSVLLLENLDRLSRQKIDHSLDLAKKILKAGVDIVTLMPERRYNADSLNNLPERLELEFTFHRAHDESVVKSERLKEKWAQRRKKMREKKVVSRRLPFWISVQDDKFILNEKVELVRTAFRMAIEGRGYVQIVRAFNSSGVKIRRAATVDRHLVRRLVYNRQVIGEHQPRIFNGSTVEAERPADGEPIQGYFPAAVSLETFHRAQQALSVRKVTGRGRSNGTVNNLFKSLMVDMHDGGPMYMIGKGGTGSEYLYIASWWNQQGKPNTCPYAFRYSWFERGVLGACREISPSLLVPQSDVDEDIARCEAEIEETALKAERAKERLARAKDMETEEVITEQMADLRRQAKELRAQLDGLKARKTTTPGEQMEKLHTFLDALGTAEDVETLRTHIRTLIGSLVDKIHVYIQAGGYIKRRCWALIKFKTGFFRKLLITKGGTAATFADDTGEMNIPVDDKWK